MISIIIPTAERHNTLIKVLCSIEKQAYKAKEIIVVYGNNTNDGYTKEAVYQCKKKFKTNILYLQTHYDGYGLAMARNMGVVESMGDILMFLDDRFELEGQVLDKIKDLKDNTWYFGIKRIKGELITDRPFVENFSWIKKKEFRKFGMFNERINIYGGMSEDVRHRWNLIRGKFQKENLVVSQILKSHSTQKKDQIIKAKQILYKLQ